MDISLHQLKVFTAVARLCSFTRAGDELGLTQSAISRSIRELESEIGLKLFDRTTRHVRLTEAGGKLSGRIGHLLQEVESVLRESGTQRDARHGNVCIASSAVPAATLLPACLAHCRSRYPDIQVTLKDAGQDAAVEAVLQGQADFALVFESPREDGLHCEALGSEPLCVVLPCSHALASCLTVDWRELAGPVLVLDGDAGGQPHVGRALLTLGGRGCPVQEFSHPATILRLVELGLGVGIMPGRVLQGLGAADLAARPLRPEIRQTMVLARRKNRAMRPGADAIWGELAGLFQGRPAVAAA